MLIFITLRDSLKEGTVENEVIVLDDLSGGFEENVHKSAKLIKGSITDIELIDSLFEEYKFEYVFH